MRPIRTCAVGAIRMSSSVLTLRNDSRSYRIHMAKGRLEHFRPQYFLLISLEWKSEMLILEEGPSHARRHLQPIPPASSAKTETDSNAESATFAMGSPRRGMPSNGRTGKKAASK